MNNRTHSAVDYFLMYETGNLLTNKKSCMTTVESELREELIVLSVLWFNIEKRYRMTSIPS